MKVAIVGSGFSGIAAAKILCEFGHDVAVFEKCPDIVRNTLVSSGIELEQGLVR